MVPTQRLPAHTHIRKKGELVALSKRRRPSSIAVVVTIDLSHRFARGILKMSIKRPEWRRAGSGQEMADSAIHTNELTSALLL